MSIKVFVKRDFSHGEYPTRFVTKLPPKLEGKISADQFSDTVTAINEFFAAAEDITCSMVCEGCCAFASLFTLYWCIPSRYERRMNELQTYLDDVNARVYGPAGVTWSHPKRAAFRHICVSLDPSRGVVRRDGRRRRAPSDGSQSGSADA